MEVDVGREDDKKKELKSILTAVNRKVSQVDIKDADDDSDDENTTKQMSWFETSLTRDIYFRNLH